MATAEQFISKAYSLILVRQKDAGLEPDEYQDGIETLNDMMSEWDGGGLSLGYTFVDNLNDEVTIPS